MFKLDLEKAEKPEVKLPTSIGSSKKAIEFQKNIYFYFIDYAKAFDLDHNKLWKILQEMGIPDHLTCLLSNLCAGHEATAPDMAQQTGFKLGKEYVKVFGVVNKAEVDVFLEFSCFSYDASDAGNLISGSSGFSKPRLNIWEFLFY